MAPTNVPSQFSLRMVSELPPALRDEDGFFSQSEDSNGRSREELVERACELIEEGSDRAPEEATAISAAVFFQDSGEEFLGAFEATTSRSGRVLSEKVGKGLEHYFQLPPVSPLLPAAMPAPAAGADHLPSCGSTLSSTKMGVAPVAGGSVFFEGGDTEGIGHASPLATLDDAASFKEMMEKQATSLAAFTEALNKQGQELSTIKDELSTTQDELSTTKDDLSTTKDELSTVKAQGKAGRAALRQQFDSERIVLVSACNDQLQALNTKNAKLAKTVLSQGERLYQLERVMNVLNLGELANRWIAAFAMKHNIVRPNNRYWFSDLVAAADNSEEIHAALCAAKRDLAPGPSNSRELSWFLQRLKSVRTNVAHPVGRLELMRQLPQTN